MKRGETKVIAFNNYGSTGQNFYNWTIVAKAGSTEKFSVRADYYDNTSRATTNFTSWNYQVASDRGGDKVFLNWDTFQSDMREASCLAVIAYGTDGSLSLRVTSECSTGRIYYIGHDVASVTGDVNVIFYVEHSYLQLLSIESCNEIVGSIDYTTPYWNTWNTTPVVINSGETGYYKFINYNSGGSNTYENWYLYAANNSKNYVVLRADNAQNVQKVDDVTYNGTISSFPTTTNLVSDLAGATVELYVSLSGPVEGKYTLTSRAHITKSNGTEMSPDYVFTQENLPVSSLNLYVSVEKSWLEVLAQGKVVNKTSSAELAGYKTFYDASTSYKVTSDNTTVYIAAKTGETTITLTELATNVIPAGTAVLLRNDNTPYTITVTPTNETVAPGTYYDNELTAAASDGKIDDAYIFAYLPGDGNGLGFYKYTSSFATGEVYLPVAGSGLAKKLSLVVDGQVTEVTAPAVAETEEPEILYNMAGQIVGKDFKGIVINQKGEKRLQK